MEDRYTAGLLSGLSASLASTAFELVLVKAFHFGQLSFFRFAAVSVFGKSPRTPAEYIVALLIHLAFCGLMGGIFSYFLKAISRRYDLVKGLAFGVSIAWTIGAVKLLFSDKPGKNSVENITANYMCSIVYGLVLALSYRKLGPREPR